MTIKGRVLNPITGEGIPDAPVLMYRSTLDYPSGKKKVKETTTDSEGYFEFSKATSRIDIHCLGQFYLQISIICQRHLNLAITSKFQKAIF